MFNDNIDNNNNSEVSENKLSILNHFALKENDTSFKERETQPTLERTRVIPPHHQNFINLLAEGRTQIESFRLAIVKDKLSNKSTESVRACNLAKKYVAEIEQVRAERLELMERAKSQAIENAALEAYNSVFSVAKVDTLLCEIMASEDASKQDKLRAMDIYYRRFGLNKPVEQKVTITKVGVEKENEEYL